MALSKDTPGKPLGGHWVDYPMLASATIYEGGLVGASSGYARALVAGDTFLGIAQKGCTETTATNGAEYCRTRVGVWRQEFALTGVAITDIGAAVYASDDGTLTLTAGTNSPVGKVVRYVGANLAEVEFHSNDANAITLSSSYDVTVKSNDDLTLVPGKAAADEVVIQAYDIDATAYVSLVQAKSHATIPQLILGHSAAGASVGFFGSTGATQQANIVACATNETSGSNISPVVASLVSLVKAYFLCATA